MQEAGGICVPDEFPARPSSLVKNEFLRYQVVKDKKKTHTVMLLSLTYFLFGISIGLNGPLYPLEADLHDIPRYIYGLVISCNFFAALLFYPVAILMVHSTTCKQTICSGMITIGCCRILFGALSLISQKLYFMILSVSIQLVEGLGVSMLIASTFVILFSNGAENKGKNNIWIMICTMFGFCLGPIGSDALNKAFGFSIPFYGVGILIVLDALLLAVLLPEPGQSAIDTNLPIVSWTKEPGMLIYASVVFVSLGYTGFLSTVLEPLLRQIHLQKITVGVLFSLPLFTCGISAPAWKWLTKKGINSLLLACFSSLFTFASLVLFIPASFTDLNESLTNVSVSLALQGVGNGGKLSCVLYAAHRDVYSKRRVNEAADFIVLIIPTMFAFSSCAGYFIGSSLTSLFVYIFGLKIFSYVLYCLEALSVTLLFTHAFKRNYRVPRHILVSEENQQLLTS